MREYNCDENGKVTVNDIDPLDLLGFISDYDPRPIGARNEVKRYEGFNISYNPHPCQGMGAMEGTSDETAIVVNPSGETKYYILNGDFRKEYETLAPQGLNACLAFFVKNQKEHGCKWGETNVTLDV